MKYVIGLLALLVPGCMSALAWETNAPPRTLIEALETHTNSVIVRGISEIGSVEGIRGALLVVAKESTDKNTRQKALGVELTVRGRANVQDVSLIDYDELGSLVKALDELAAPQWSDTSMPQLEMVYTTKDGLRLATFSNRNGTATESSVRSTHAVQATAVLNTAQLGMLRNMLDQAKAKLDAIARAAQ